MPESETKLTAPRWIENIPCMIKPFHARRPTDRPNLLESGLFLHSRVVEVVSTEGTFLRLAA